MFHASSRSLRTLLIAAALTGGAATAATPALAAGPGKTSHGKSAKPATAKASKKAKSKKVADLVVQDLGFEVFSATIEVDAMVANTGGGRANRSTTTVAISTDATLSASDDIVATTPTNRVKSGTSTKIATEFEIPEELPEGDLYLLVCADTSGAVKERAETNNCAVELLASADDDVATDDDGEGDGPADDSVDLETDGGE